jgi:predicted MFS family arabinose efflux permease
MLVAPTVGPALGGLITTYAGWRWIFLINLPVGAITLVLTGIFVPRDTHRFPRAFDLPGFALTTLTVVLALLGMQGLGNHGRLAQSLLMLVVAGVVGRRAYAHLQRTQAPILDLSPLSTFLFRLGALGSGFLVRLALRGYPFVFALMLQLQFGMSPLGAGLLILAVDAGDLLIKPAVSPTLNKFGFRRTLCAACLVASVGMLLTSMLGRSTYPVVTFAALALIGTARSYLFSGISGLTFIGLDQKRMGDGAILFQVMVQIGNAAAITLAGLALQARNAFGIGPSTPQLADFRVGLLFMGFITLLALPGLLGLPNNLYATRIEAEPAGADSGVI